MLLQSKSYTWSRILTVSLFFVLFTMIVSGCDPHALYDKSVSVPEKGWNKDSIAEFHFDVNDTTSLYNFYITLRNTDDYPYRNFYFFLSTQLPNKNITHDTIELTLADLKGKWLGKGFGSTKDNQVLVRKDLKFPLKGTYTFRIEQAMREESLKGIADVGIRVEYAK